MTPAVTAIALMKFARVETSTSAGIGHTPKKKTDATRDMLNRIDKWSIDFHFYRLLFRRKRCRSHHRHGRRGGGFRSFFIDCDKGLVKDLRDKEVIVRFIERRFHPKRLEFFC